MDLQTGARCIKWAQGYVNTHKKLYDTQSMWGHQSIPVPLPQAHADCRVEWRSLEIAITKFNHTRELETTQLQIQDPFPGPKASKHRAHRSPRTLCMTLVMMLRTYTSPYDLWGRRFEASIIGAQLCTNWISHKIVRGAHWGRRGCLNKLRRRLWSFRILCGSKKPAWGRILQLQRRDVTCAASKRRGRQASPPATENPQKNKKKGGHACAYSHQGGASTAAPVGMAAAQILQSSNARVDNVLHIQARTSEKILKTMTYMQCLIFNLWGTRRSHYKDHVWHCALLSRTNRTTTWNILKVPERSPSS
jgi:hypothetical protein